MIDTHAHLDAEEFDGDREAVIERARQAGVEAIVCPAISGTSSEACVRLAELHPEIFAAVGIQPNDAVNTAPDDWDRVVSLVGHRRVVALGETGLDRYWDFTPFDVQQDYFDRHLRLAQECDLPVIVHCREAEADVLAMLHDAASRGPLRGVMHSFSGDEEFARQCVDLGLYLSFSGSVTYPNKKFAPLHAAAASVPADRLLVETDSPFLVPQPLRGKLKRNEPAWMLHTIARLAELRGTQPDLIASQTVANAQRLFRLGSA